MGDKMKRLGGCCGMWFAVEWKRRGIGITNSGARMKEVERKPPVYCLLVSIVHAGSC